jgi:hypothetical protein
MMMTGVFCVNVVSVSQLRPGSDHPVCYGAKQVHGGYFHVVSSLP